MRIEYRMVESAQTGDLVWRYDKYAVLSGPFIITKWTQHWPEFEPRWWMLNANTGEEVSCFKNQLRKAHVIEK